MWLAITGTTARKIPAASGPLSVEMPAIVTERKRASESMNWNWSAPTVPSRPP